MKFNQLLIAAAFAATLTSCGDESSTITPGGSSNEVSGNVEGVWEKGSLQIVQNHLIVPEGKSLTIEEGVTIVMNDTTIRPEIIVHGNIYFKGTESNPITITVPEELRTESNRFARFWGGVIASDKCEELLVEHTIFEYAGAITTEESASVKQGLFKGEAGEGVPAINFVNLNGRMVIMNSIFRNLGEDGMYIEGGNSIVAYNQFFSVGQSGGDAINYKSGTKADICYNLLYSPNTNALKLSNSGDRPVQAHIKGYNNTLINNGWRRPDVKGGSIWIEKGVKADIFNNLIVNCRFGLKTSTKDPQDASSTFGNNYYYGNEDVAGYQPSESDGVLGSSSDILSAVAGDNNPMFANYDLSNSVVSTSFSSSWNFKLNSGSPALSAGSASSVTPHFSTSGITVNGTTYRSPAPANYCGAYGQN